MGKIETGIKREIRMTKVQTAVLSTIYAVGMLSVALLAPNVLRVMNSVGKKSGFNEKMSRGRRQSINVSRKRLIEMGLVEYKNGFLCLTKKGEEKMREFEAREFKLEKPKKWDGKWRVLIFDVAESRRSIRDKIRNTLSSIGFMRLQDSVWVYPYDCEDLIVLFKADMKIGKDLLYMIVDKLENDSMIRKNFNLS